MGIELAGLTVPKTVAPWLFPSSSIDCTRSFVPDEEKNLNSFFPSRGCRARSEVLSILTIRDRGPCGSDAEHGLKGSRREHETDISFQE